MAEDLDIAVEVIGAAPILRAFRDLPKEAVEKLRDASKEMSVTLAEQIAAAARHEGRQAALMAPTVKPRRNRVPAVVAGGAKKVGRKRVPAGALLFGSEFGAHLPQFRPHLSGGSYWFYETVKEKDSEIYAKWLAVAEELISSFGGAGSGE